MTDLDRLIDEVEAGDDDAVTTANRRLGSAAHDVGLLWPGHDVGKAFGGSLDAAQRLHDSLLPGWDYSIDNVQRRYPFVYVVYDGGAEWNASAASAARAWLLAILRALKAKGDRNGTV